MRYIEKLPYWFRALIVVAITGVSLQFIMASDKKPEYNPMIKFYNLSTQIQTPRKMMIDRIAITSASQTIDISAAGFTSISNVALIGENNTATLGNMPVIIIKSFTTTSVTFNTIVGNTSVVLLGSAILSPTTFTGMFVDIVVLGN